MLKKVELTNATTGRKLTAIVDTDTDEGALIGAGKAPNESAKITDIVGVDEKIHRMSSPGGSMADRAALFAGVARCLDRNIAMIKSFELQSNRVKSPRYRGIIADISAKLSLGEPVSDAMAGHPDAFGPEVIALVRAGEEAGRLPVIFKQLANSQQKTLRIFRKLKNGMIYPAIVLLMSIGVIIVMSYTLVPAVSKLYGSFEAELPAATKLMMVISDTLINYPWTVLIPFVLVFMLFKNMKKITANPSVQRFMLKVPGLGSIVRKAAAAVSFRALSMLMESNVRLGTSLQITADAAPHVYYKEFFTNVREHIDAGLGLSESFLLESHLLGPDGRSICGIMDIAAETGGANDMLDEIANDYEEELDGYASQIDKVLEPITIIVLGTMVGFLIYAIYGPIFGMGDVVLPDK